MTLFNCLTRRDLLKSSACGFGYLALANLMAENSHASIDLLTPKQPHFTPRAKRVIFIFLAGAPSPMETIEYKPKLYQLDGQRESNTGGTGNNRKYLAPQWGFKQYGESGRWFSDLLPNLAQHADKFCSINSLTTDNPSHPQATLQLHTGSFRFTRPSIGSWILHGLGTENQELPGFIAINPIEKVGGTQNYSNAFLSSAYGATRIGAEGQKVSEIKISHTSNPRLSDSAQRRQIELLGRLHDARSAKGITETDQQLDSIISSYDLAFRMQQSIPNLMDLSTETKETLEDYGIGTAITDDFGRQCLMARRFAEAGVRFIEICDPGWDHHTNLRRGLVERTTATDKPVSALLADLHQRGLLDDTLVIWGGEFGRTATAEGIDGRDHNIHGYPMLFAGAGVKPGFTYGATDELGITAVEKKCHVYDLHATILHILGLNHEELTYEYGGRSFRLTDVFGEVLHEVLS